MEARGLGQRDSRNFQKLYEKIERLENYQSFTDAWNAFAEALPSERYAIGKAHLIAVEQNNNDTRHFFWEDLRVEQKLSQ
ncbi:MAG: hypothetical protein LBM75_09855 [Myxococcales bacterium]|nr:hypothetical protein [Myxococcales bacterium]